MNGIMIVLFFVVRKFVFPFDTAKLRGIFSATIFFLVFRLSLLRHSPLFTTNRGKGSEICRKTEKKMKSEECKTFAITSSSHVDRMVFLTSDLSIRLILYLCTWT